MDRTEEVGEMLTDMDSTGILSDWVDGGGETEENTFECINYCINNTNRNALISCA